MSRRRVVVTGLGLTSPVGNTVADGWANLVAGKSGIAEITKFDATNFSTRFAGEVKGFNVEDYMPAKEARHMDTFIHYGIRTLLTELLAHLRAIEERIHFIEISIHSFMKQSALCGKIAQIPGIGPITATAIVAEVGDARQFRNGWHLAAWLGLVPRQYSSGGKSRLYHISQGGDTYLRTLLIHGARAVLRFVTTKTDVHSVWLQQLIARRGYNCTAVALANDSARYPGITQQ